MGIDPITIIKNHYDVQSPLFKLLVNHGRQVGHKALAIADDLADPGIDRGFLWEAAILHDIGICKTRAPKMGCRGTAPYICHGILGREILEGHHLNSHALVAERQVGIGLKRQEIKTQALPLPDRDMRPITIEEQLVCYADKFFSKTGSDAGQPKPVANILNSLKQFGDRAVFQFCQWMERFEPALVNPNKG